MPKVTTRSRAGVRETTQKTENHSGVSDAGSIQREEPIARPPQQPPRPLRRPHMRPQVSGSGSRDVPSASSLENHETCLATVETLERENEALRRDKKALLERLESAESAMQELLSHQHRCRQEFLSGRWLNNWWMKCSIPLQVGISGFGKRLVYQNV
ncbi:hypothetical protein CBS76997_11259 [Aspergillus niger]|nr:hypothetical protein CBS13152_11253 [Aspergillus niger]KAI3033783.1 hypothetical protein CBS76997_11259 [Aspergillus niger]